jgi:leucyl aminopeptidase
MLFSHAEHLNKRKDADLIVLPFWQRKKGKQKIKSAAVLTGFEALIQPAMESGDFGGSAGEILLLYVKNSKEKRVLLLGLGREEDLTVESLRKAYSNVTKECQKKGIRAINVVVPTVSELRKISVEECLKGISEGILLTNYRWEKLASVDEETVLLKEVSLIGILPKMLEGVKECELIAEGVYVARDLINGNADIVTPKYLAAAAIKIEQKFPSVKATIFDQKRIEKENMGLFLAVARGAAVEPTFIILNYRGFPNSKDHTLLIGKGVTFDTGGLNLKPTGSMETMRDDMSGAAAVLSTIAVAASLKLKLNVTAVVAATENAIDGKSYKPGDVYKGYSGVTVEIGNTDAEGRLTLADALAYSVDQLKPTRLIDLATLTGSVVVALGEGLSGLFCNDEELARGLLDASKRSAEGLWRMPLHAPYKEQLKSDIADIKNTGGRPAGSITAALFLQEFVSKIPWAHIDIAGTAFGSKEKGYWPKNGVGFGVRLLVDFLQHLSKKK